MLKQVDYWVRNYGSAGIGDLRAVQDYITCETNEAVQSLRNELIGLSHGKFSEDVLDRIVGIKRKTLHNSYVEWSKLMLQWIANNFRGS